MNMAHVVPSNWDSLSGEKNCYDDAKSEVEIIAGKKDRTVGFFYFESRFLGDYLLNSNK